MKIGYAVKEFRIKLNLTQAEVCERSGITQGFYSSIENGNHTPSFESLQKISKAFDIPLILIIWRATEKSDLKRSSIINNIKHHLDATLNKFFFEE